MHVSIEKLWRPLGNHGLVGGYSAEAARELRAASDECAHAGLWLAASHGYRRAAQLVWGEDDKELLIECLEKAVTTAFNGANSSSMSWQGRVLALHWAAYGLSSLAIGSTDSAAAIRAKVLGVELARAEAMLAAADNSELAEGLLVGGVLVGTNLEEVQVIAPEGGVSPGGGGELWGGGGVSVEIMSAAEAFIRIGDFERAWELLGPRREAAHRTGRLGWYHAAHGCAVPASSEQAFLEAAKAFESETVEEAHSKHRCWTAVGRDLWAPFFRSRSCLAGIASRPNQASDLIIAAAGAIGAEPIMWCNPEVELYRFTVNALSAALVENRLDTQDVAEAARVMRRYDVPAEDSSVAIEFAQCLAAGVEAAREGLASDAVEHFARANTLLRRLPIIGTSNVQKIADCVLSAGLLQLPPRRSTLHGKLEALKSEDQLRRILLRLFQEQAPIHAQIVHGPVEYGKDLVLVQSHDGRTILRMYQAKLGDISLRDWGRVREQMETMFQVPYQTPQLSGEPEERIGVIVFNGHIQPYADPAVAGWVAEQKRVFNRTVEIMNIDGLVDYIVSRRLYAAFHAALLETPSIP